MKSSPSSLPKPFGYCRVWLLKLFWFMGCVPLSPPFGMISDKSVSLSAFWALCWTPFTILEVWDSPALSLVFTPILELLVVKKFCSFLGDCTFSLYPRLWLAIARFSVDRCPLLSLGLLWLISCPIFMISLILSFYGPSLGVTSPERTWETLFSF